MPAKIIEPTTEKGKSGDAKVAQTMHEFKHGTLHSGSKKGPKVTNRRQALAIALSQAGRASKAANYSARAGGTIVGNLARANDGKFTSGSGGGGAAPAKKPGKAEAAARQRQEREDLAARQREERLAARDQEKTEAQQKAVENVGNLAEKLLDPDMAEVLTVGDPLGNIEGVEPEYGDKLVARGLATKYEDGSYDLNPTGRSMVNAMKKGNERQAKVAIMRAKAQADRKAAAAAKRAKRGKKEQFTLAIKAAGSFKAYKDFAGADFFGLDIPEPEHTGVMIALMIPPGIAETLVVPGGEKPGDLHLTLAYLGDSTEIPLENKKLVMDALDQFYATAKPLTGEISGIGLFNNAEEGGTNAFYASFDSPDLAQFRANLISALSFNGMSVVSNHGFTPHITLAYLPVGAALPQISLPKIPVTFNSVTLMWGGQPFEFILDEKSLKPGEVNGVLDLFDKGLDAASKEIQKEIASKEKAAKPFTAYKDASGRWRWLVRSSSAFEDRDGETVSQKALENAVEKLNARGRYGIIDWWHTPVQLGTCDFSAMHGRVLVESGTFVNEQVGERIGAAIKSGKFNPGASLMFAHKEPGPQVVPGRVFEEIEIIQRSLLPEDRASNAVTTMEIINLAAKSGQTAKEVILKMDAVKEQKLKELLGPDLVEKFLSGSTMAEKALESFGLSYKAMAPAAALPVEDDNLTKLDAKADGVEDPAMLEDAAVEEDPDPEDMGEDGDPNAALDDLYADIEKIVAARVGEAVTEIKAALSTVGSGTASKEVTDLVTVQALALKETTNLLEKFGADMTAMKSQLAALEGKQPPAVRQRTSANKDNEVTDPKLLEALKEQKKTTLDPNDPFAGFYQNWEANGAPLPLNR